MNVGHRKKQRKLCDTVIPLSNPEPAPGEEDTCSQVQKMSFPDGHPNPELRGQAKGIKNILQEHKSIWNEYTMICVERGTRLVGKCTPCSKSQTQKDAECHGIFAEAAGQEDAASADDMIAANSATPSTPRPDEWCCMHRVLSLQEDFRTERPLIQTLIEDAGHICLFLPRFHCELNPIEMLWGYGKYRACISLACMVMH